MDFRGQAESAALSYELPHVRYQALPIEPIVVQRAKEMALAGQPMTAPTAVRLMQDTYRAFVSDNTSQFVSLFEQLLLEDTPLVFHCTAGKGSHRLRSRPGFACPGVSQEVVMQDYLLTNGLYRRPAGLASSAPEEVLNVIWRVGGVSAGRTAGGDRDHGGVQRHLKHRLGMRADQASGGTLSAATCCLMRSKKTAHGVFSVKHGIVQSVASLSFFRARVLILTDAGLAGNQRFRP